MLNAENIMFGWSTTDKFEVGLNELARKNEMLRIN